MEARDYGSIHSLESEKSDVSDAKLTEDSSSAGSVDKAGAKTQSNWWSTLHWVGFNIICFLTGQFYIKNKWYSVSLIPGLIIIGSINLYSTVFNFYVISCPYRNCGYIDTVRPHNSSKSFLLTGPEPLKAIYYNDFQKFVFTCASIAGTLSYFCIIASINYNHLKSGYRFIKKVFKNNDSGDEGESSSLLDRNGDNDDTEKGDDKFLSPFHDHEALNGKQVCIFWAIFAFNCALYVGSAVVFFIIFYQELDENASKKMKFWDAFGLVSQFVSWFCAILSCFIFSKLAHTISNKCVNDLFQHLKEVNKRGIKKDIYATLNEKFGLNMSQRHTDKNLTFFEVMKDLDREYAKVMKNSLECYGTWFAIHWLSYTVTAFLAIAYFVQHVKEDMYNNDEFHCHKEANQICKLSLVYDLLFCLSHCILFLYPCFRAASVTAARYKVIRKISRADWKNIPFDQMQAFIQYMERQDCTFKVSILCATVTFGFNLAYFSIFAGIMTVILKISL